MFSDDVEREYPRLAMDWGSIRKTWWLFFRAAGGCGYCCPRVGQPTAAAIAGLRGRPAVKAAIQPRCFASACAQQQQPRPFVVSEARRAVYASLLDPCAGAGPM